MKKRITSYTFNASAKTIVSADFASLESVLLITNVTDGIIIYNFADPARGATLSGTTLTLDYDTTSMDNADKLQIFIDDGGSEEVDLVTLIAGEDLPNDVLKVAERSTYAVISADTLIKTGPGALKGMFVSAASATPTIKFWDAVTAATPALIDTFTPVAATYYPFPGAEFGVGLFADLGGTVTGTVFYK